MLWTAPAQHRHAIAVRVDGIGGVQRVVGARVGGDELRQRLHHGGEVEDAGRKVAADARSVHHAAHQDDDRLVDRAPEVDQVAELPAGVGGELGELVDDGRVEPAAVQDPGRDGTVERIHGRERVPDRDRVVQPERQGEVVQRDHGLEAAARAGSANTAR